MVIKDCGIGRVFQTMGLTNMQVLLNCNKKITLMLSDNLARIIACPSGKVNLRLYIQSWNKAPS